VVACSPSHKIAINEKEAVAGGASGHLPFGEAISRIPPFFSTLFRGLGKKRLILELVFLQFYHFFLLSICFIFSLTMLV
jgi:hypothetical protein